MGISVANTTSGTAGGASATTASVSPTANTLQLFTVFNGVGNGVTPNQPTVSGAGLTWVVAASILATDTAAAPTWATVFRALGASPSTGALTIDFGGQANLAFWILDQVSGTDTTGTNGSGAIVQSATNHGTSSPLTVTLSAFGSTSNGTYGSFGVLASGAVTLSAGSGFTKVVEVDGTLQAIATEWRVDNSTSVPMSSSASPSTFSGIGLEIKVPAVALDEEGSLTFAYRRNW